MVSFTKDEMRERILDLYNKDDTYALRKLLEDYSLQFGKDEFYYHISADLYLDQRKYETALKLLEEAILRGFDGPGILQAKAEAHFGKEDYLSALQALLEIDDSNPEWTPMIFDLRALCYEGLQLWKEAARCYEDYLLEDENAEILIRAVIAYLKLGNEKRAYEYFERFLNMDNAIIYDDLSYSLIEMGYSDLARVLLGRFIDDKEMVEELVTTTELVVADNPQEAIRYLKKRLDQVPSASRYAILASLYNQTDQRDMELKTFRKILQSPMAINGDMSMEEDLRHRLNALQNLNYTRPTVRKYLSRYIYQYAHNLSSRILLMEFAVAYECYSEFYELMHLPIEEDQMNRHLMIMYERTYMEYLKKTGQYERLYQYLKHSNYVFKDTALQFELGLAACQIGNMEEGIQILEDMMPDGYSAIMLLRIYELYGMESEKRQLLKYMEDIVESVSSIDIEGYQEYLHFLHNHN